MYTLISPLNFGYVLVAVDNYCHFLTDGLVICHLPFGPTASFSITNTVMRHDIPDVGTMSEAAPHLIFHNFKTELGQRVGVCVCGGVVCACVCVMGVWVGIHTA